MIKKNLKKAYSKYTKYKLTEESRILLHQITNFANQNIPKIDFLKKILHLLVDFSKTDELELWFIDIEKKNNYECVKYSKESFLYETIPFLKKNDAHSATIRKEDFNFKQLCFSVMTGDVDPSCPFITKKGRICIGDINNLYTLFFKSKKRIPISCLYDRYKL